MADAGSADGWAQTLRLAGRASGWERSAHAEVLERELRRLSHDDVGEAMLARMHELQTKESRSLVDNVFVSSADAEINPCRRLCCLASQSGRIHVSVRVVRPPGSAGGVPAAAAVRVCTAAVRRRGALGLVPGVRRGRCGSPGGGAIHLDRQHGRHPPRGPKPGCVGALLAGERALGLDFGGPAAAPVAPAPRAGVSVRRGV